jgi:hypothetical protein
MVSSQTLTTLNELLSHRVVGVILFVAFLMLWAATAKAYTQSWQVQSRMATVQTLVEQGTFVIDDTLFNNTGDKIFVNGHFYSDKTPILSVAAAGAYAILHGVFGLTLDPAFCLPDDDPMACRAFGGGEPRLTALYWLTVLFMGVPSALIIYLFRREMIVRETGGVMATGLAVLLGIASPIAPYSTVFSGHIPAALCLFAGFVLLTRPANRARFFWAGALIGLAANIDFLLTLLVVAFGVWVLAERRSFLAVFVAGALIPYAVTSAINYVAVGSIVPVYLDPKAYDYPGAVLHKTAGGTDGFYSLEFGLRYLYDMFVGRRGVFAFTPLLLYALGGMWIAARDLPPALAPLATCPRAFGAGVAAKRRGSARGSPQGGEDDRSMRGLTLAALGGSLAFAAYLIVRTDNFGGLAWGTRWFVPLVPMLWFYLPFVLERRHGRAWWAVFAAAVILSVWSVPMGLHDAWKDFRPILRLETTAIDYPE